MCLVSVCMICYNQEDYIEQAIKGIIEQVTSFEFEFIIANDASIDNTHNIILQATKMLPSHVKLKYYNHSQNLGLIPNAIFALKQCTGKYISFCEGDDYWIDSQKLENQINFLESHPEYNLITGAVRRFNQNSKLFIEPIRINDYDFTYKDMIVRNHCISCTTTFRNYIKYDVGFKLFEERGIDSQIWIRALGKNGKGKYLGQITAVYRKHEGGASTKMHNSTNTFEKKMASAKRKINKAIFWNNYFDKEAKESVLKVENKMYKYMLKLSLRNAHPKFSSLYFIKFIKTLLLLKLKRGNISK